VFLNGHYLSTPHSSPRYSHHPKSQSFICLETKTPSPSTTIYRRNTLLFGVVYRPYENRVILRHSDIDCSTQLRACFAPPPLSAIIWSIIYTTTPLIHPTGLGYHPLRPSIRTQNSTVPWRRGIKGKGKGSTVN